MCISARSCSHALSLFLRRDIKCSNLLIGCDHTLKLADFGLAREFSRDTEHYTNKVKERMQCIANRPRRHSQHCPGLLWHRPLCGVHAGLLLAGRTLLSVSFVLLSCRSLLFGTARRSCYWVPQLTPLLLMCGPLGASLVSSRTFTPPHTKRALFLHLLPLPSIDPQLTLK